MASEQGMFRKRHASVMLMTMTGKEEGEEEEEEDSDEDVAGERVSLSNNGGGGVIYSKKGVKFSQAIETFAYEDEHQKNVAVLIATPLAGVVLFVGYFLTVVLSVPSNYESDKLFVWIFAVDCTFWPLTIVCYMVTVNERLRQTSAAFVKSLSRQLTREELLSWRPAVLEGMTVALCVLVIFLVIAEAILLVLLWTFPNLEVFGRPCDLTVQCNYCTDEYPCTGPKLAGDVRWQLIFSIMFRVLFLFVTVSMYGRVQNITALHSASVYDIDPIVAARVFAISPTQQDD